MFTHWLKVYSVPFAISIAGVGIHAGPASAGVCELADGNRDTGWSITFDDAQVSNCVFTGNPGDGRNKGTLSLTLRVVDQTPIPIQFVEETAPAEDSFGLRITWNVTLDNQFQLLRGIRGEAFDDSPKLDDDDNEFVADEHPGFAHFHQDGTFNPGPFPGAPDCDCESRRDFRVRGEEAGSFPASTTGTVSGIGVHQIEERGQQRNFTVKVEPLRAEVAPNANQ
ncbi:hypothetical protein ID144_09635 [Pseudomonas sp. JM0905a]|uniref:Uncharacterized protein n=1 Tax=Metapseudomonas resinovorans TaxID=53412 RepID=A0ABT4Y6T3_METRE|nr:MULTISPECIES: hypothetical protein [Pseudomonas]MBD2837296.1 hypothetical protein [Pseudomonas sp. JM0905a]MDA8484582.1 hypothetical protein [Pseudomonas resinovorans]